MTHEDEYRQMHLRASEPQPRTTYIVGPPAALAAYTRLIAGDSRYLVVDSTDPVVTLRPVLIRAAVQCHRLREGQ